MELKFHIGWCPFCNQGWISIARYSVSNRLLLLCEECDTIWENPDDIKNDKPLISNSFLGQVQEPEFNEIQKAGWDKFLIKNMG